MQNEWNDELAQDLGDDPIALREYSAKLLSKKGTSFRLLPSVKFDSTNVFGEKESIIRVGEESESLCLHLDRISRLANLPNLEAKQLQFHVTIQGKITHSQKRLYICYQNKLDT